MPGVFISYAREDLEFARHLYDALLAAGRDPTWDQDHGAVPFSARWRPEIQAAIENSDKFVFIISPDSLDSGPCANELTHATEVHKQVIPIVARPPREGQPVPAPAEELNWIFFTDSTDRAAFDRAFGQLTAALDTDLDWAKAHTRLLTRSSEWAARQQDNSLLLQGSDLRGAEEWLAKAGEHENSPPTSAQRAFVAASRRAADRSARRWRGALAAGLAISIALAVTAFIQRGQARHEASIAQARALAAEATAQLTADPAQSLRLALQSTRVSPGAAGLRALRLALAADHLRMAIQPGSGAATQATWSPAAETIAVTARGNSVELWNPRTGRLARRLGSLPSSEPISQLAYNSRGSLLAAVAGNGGVALWNPLTGSAVNTDQLNADIRAHWTGKYQTLTGAWNPRTGDLYLYGTGLRTVLIYRPGTGKVGTLSLGGPVDDLVFAPSGSRAFIVKEASPASADVTAQIVNLSNGTHVAVRKPRSLFSWSSDARACWTPDGSEIVTWNPVEAQDPVLRVFSPQTGAELFERDGSTYNAAACGTTSRGPYVAAGDYGGAGTLLQHFAPDPRSPRRFTVVGLYGHTQLINSVATSPDGKTIATGSDDGSVRIWDAVSGHQLSLIQGNGRQIKSVQFSPDGGAVLAVAANGVVLVADDGTGEPDVRLQSLGAGRAYALGFAAGSRLVYGVNEVTRAGRASQDPQITQTTGLLWRADDGSIAASYVLPASPAVGPMACPSALQIETSCDLAAPPQEFTGFAVSQDGRYLAYSTSRGVVARPFARGPTARLALTGRVTGLTFAGPADGIVVMTDQVVDVWRPFGGRRLASLAQPSPPIDAELSGNGDRLATANVGGHATIWDVPSGRPLARFRPHQARADPTAPVPVRVALNASGTYLVLGTDLGSVDIWQVPDHRLIASHLVISASTNTAYAITELGLARHGRDVVAVNFPQIGAGDSEPPGTAEIMATATGRVLTELASPAQEVPPVNPGMAISPDGSYVLGGTEGFAPTSAEAGRDAVYDIGGSQELEDLQNTLERALPVNPGEPNVVPFNAWAADGIHLLTGGPAIYACDSCGSLNQMQSAARLRLAWAVPLAAKHDDPPSGDAFS